MHKAFFSNSGGRGHRRGTPSLHGSGPGRKKFVAFTHGFHGRTVGSLAVTHKPGDS